MSLIVLAEWLGGWVGDQVEGPGVEFVLTPHDLLVEGPGVEFVTPDPGVPSAATPPDLHDSTDRLYSYLVAFHDQTVANRWEDPLYGLCHAFTAPAFDLDLIARGTDTLQPWEAAFDLDAAPLWVLPWLTVFAGVDWHGPPTEALRTQLKDRPRDRRGTASSMIAAVKATLTSQTVTTTAPLTDDTLLTDGTLLTDDGVATTGSADPFVLLRPNILGHRHHIVVVKSEECPDPAATRRAALSELPAFHQLTLRVGAGYTYAEMTADYATYAAAAAAFESYAALAANQHT